jgi:predicted ABC-type sugar transport system permease subunit
MTCNVGSSLFFVSTLNVIILMWFILRAWQLYHTASVVGRMVNATETEKHIVLIVVLLQYLAKGTG